MTGFGALIYVMPEQRLGVFIAYNQESGSLADAVVSRLASALPPPGSTPSNLRGTITFTRR